MVNVLLLLNSLGVIFFVVLTLVGLYFYLRLKENVIALYLATAFLFFSVRELTYLLGEVFDPNLKVIGSVMAFFAALLLLYVFIAEERTWKDIRRIARAFK